MLAIVSVALLVVAVSGIEGLAVLGALVVIGLLAAVNGVDWLLGAVLGLVVVAAFWGGLYLLETKLTEHWSSQRKPTAFYRCPRCKQGYIADYDPGHCPPCPNCKHCKPRFGCPKGHTKGIKASYTTDIEVPADLVQEHGDKTTNADLGEAETDNWEFRHYWCPTCGETFDALVELKQDRLTPLSP